MKKILALFTALTACFAVCAQTPLFITKSGFNYNTIGEGGLTVDFILPLEDDTIDPDDFIDINKGVKARLVSIEGNAIDNAVLAIGVTRISVRVFIEKLSKSDLKMLEKNTDKYFIEVSEKINLTTTKGNKHTVDASEFKKHSIGKIMVTSDIGAEIINAAGGPIYAIQNVLDFGISPRKDTVTNQVEYFLQFGYRKAYSVNSMPFFFFGEGLLSTHADDSLTFVNIYPVNYKFIGKENEMVAQLGIEGNQRFTNFRASGTIYWQGLIPNLVDLTMGEDRLRLRPVLKLGVKFYQEFQNNRPAETEEEQFGNQFYSELYYYIPVKKLYSLTLRGNAFYDVNEEVNPDKEIKFNYSVVLGIEVPGTGIKTIFKYLRGENSITYEKDEMLMIGFMADLFSVQRK